MLGKNFYRIAEICFAQAAIPEGVAPVPEGKSTGRITATEFVNGSITTRRTA